MPTKPPRLCRMKGCTTYIREGSWCDKHKQTWTHEKSAHARGYGKDWRKLRAAILARDGFACKLCGNPATQVDHIRPKAHGGADDESNLRAICENCHRVKTGEDSARGRRGR